jgi:hypothetical protein
MCPQRQSLALICLGRFPHYLERLPRPPVAGKFEDGLDCIRLVLVNKMVSPEGQYLRPLVGTADDNYFRPVRFRNP